MNCRDQLLTFYQIDGQLLIAAALNPCNKAVPFSIYRILRRGTVLYVRFLEVSSSLDVDLHGA